MCSRGYKTLLRFDIGRTRYKKAWDFQKQLIKLRAESKIPDCLIITEHEPVITMGRGTSLSNLLSSKEYLKEKGIDLFEVERGGDITFHGPGQTVLYPIIDLNNRGRDTHQYLRDLERFVIRTLEDINLQAGTKKGLTGIWVNDHKIGAIGVAVSKWIAYHGLALNVSTDLEYFKLINPCGITEFPVGTISGMLGVDIEMEYLNGLLADNFAEMFNYQMEPVDDIDDFLSQFSMSDEPTL